jgi:hypothetical protein
MKKSILLSLLALAVVFSACTQETQNKLGRSIQNWTGTNGVLDIYMGEKLAKRFVKIDKLSTAEATDGTSVSRNYRYGYGYIDENLNYKVDKGEKKVYFEVSNFSNYIFYDNPVVQ